MSEPGNSNIYKSRGVASGNVHKTTHRFWTNYRRLPVHIQRLADKQFQLLKKNPSHPSLNFKKLEGHDYWSARITRGYRAVAFEDEEGFVWFSIGKHDDVYESLRL